MPRTLLYTFEDTLAPGEKKTLSYPSQVHATVREVRCKTEPASVYVTTVAAGRDAMTMGSPIPLLFFVPAPNAINDGLEGDLRPDLPLIVGLHNEGQNSTRVELEIWGDQFDARAVA